MYAGDIRLVQGKPRLSTRIVLTWRLWSKGYMPLTVAIRTFFN